MVDSASGVSIETPVGDQGSEELQSTLQLMAQTLAQLQQDTRQQLQLANDRIRRLEEASERGARTENNAVATLSNQKGIKTPAIGEISQEGGVPSGECDGERSVLELMEVRVAKLEQSVHRLMESICPTMEELMAPPEKKETSSSEALPPLPRNTSSPPPDYISSIILQGATNSSQCHLGQELYSAAFDGRAQDLRQLLDAGADANYRNASGQTPLMWASCNGNRAVVALLLEQGADPNATRSGGRTALHCAAENDASGECVRLLAECGADVDCKDGAGWTPLHWAAIVGNEAAAMALLAAGASKDITDNYRKLPLNVAVSDALRKILQP